MSKEQKKENQEDYREIDHEEIDLIVKLTEMVSGEDLSWKERETLNRLKNWARSKRGDRER